MARLILSIAITLVIIYAVPFLVYSVFTVVVGLQPPEEASPALFLLSILISKIGTAIVFVLLFWVARSVFTGRWLLYGCLWWLMFVLGEIGQAVGPAYTWTEAVAGMISETIYCPLSAMVVDRVIGRSTGTKPPGGL
jgi:hypothetical protein